MSYYWVTNEDKTRQYLTCNLGSCLPFFKKSFLSCFSVLIHSTMSLCIVMFIESVFLFLSSIFPAVFCFHWLGIGMLYFAARDRGWMAPAMLSVQRLTSVSSAASLWKHCVFSDEMSGLHMHLLLNGTWNQHLHILSTAIHGLAQHCTTGCVPSISNQ